MLIKIQQHLCRHKKLYIIILIAVMLAAITALTVALTLKQSDSTSVTYGDIDMSLSDDCLRKVNNLPQDDYTNLYILNSANDDVITITPDSVYNCYDIYFDSHDDTDYMHSHDGYYFGTKNNLEDGFGQEECVTVPVTAYGYRTSLSDVSVIWCVACDYAQLTDSVNDGFLSTYDVDPTGKILNVKIDKLSANTVNYIYVQTTQGALSDATVKQQCLPMYYNQQDYAFLCNSDDYNTIVINLTHYAGYYNINGSAYGLNDSESSAINSISFLGNNDCDFFNSIDYGLHAAGGHGGFETICKTLSTKTGVNVSNPTLPIEYYYNNYAHCSYYAYHAFDNALGAYPGGLRTWTTDTDGNLLAVNNVTSLYINYDNLYPHRSVRKIITNTAQYSTGNKLYDSHSINKTTGILSYNDRLQQTVSNYALTTSPNFNFAGVANVPAAPHRFDAELQRVRDTHKQPCVFFCELETAKYNVIYNYRDADGKPASTVTSADYGTVPEIPTIPTAPHCNFSGWDGNINGSITQQTVFNACYTDNQYSITYNVNGNISNVAAATYYTDNSDTLLAYRPPDSVIPPGNIFLGWARATGGTVITDCSGVAGDITLYAIIGAMPVAPAPWYERAWTTIYDGVKSFGAGVVNFVKHPIQSIGSWIKNLFGFGGGLSAFKSWLPIILIVIAAVIFLPGAVPVILLICRKIIAGIMWLLNKIWSFFKYLADKIINKVKGIKK